MKKLGAGLVIGFVLGAALVVAAQDDRAIVIQSLAIDAPCAAWLQQAERAGNTNAGKGFIAAYRLGYIDGTQSALWALRAPTVRSSLLSRSDSSTIVTAVNSACNQHPEKAVMHVLLNFLGYR